MKHLSRADPGEGFPSASGGLGSGASAHVGFVTFHGLILLTSRY
jgi:hypothetical protein